MDIINVKIDRKNKNILPLSKKELENEFNSAINKEKKYLCKNCINKKEINIEGE